MQYRTFEVPEPLEQKLFAAHDPQACVPLLVGALTEQGFHVADEAALAIAQTIFEKHRDEGGNSQLVKGFDVCTREDGSQCLGRYRFENLQILFEMEDADDWDITREKIARVYRSGRVESRASDIVIPDTVTEISRYSFYRCRGIRRIVIPEGVREIGSMAFCDCKELEEIVLPASLTKIGPGAFAGCVSLSSIRLPEGLETVASLAFCGCNALEWVVLPNTLKELGYGAFAHCTVLTEVYAPTGLTLPAEKHVFYGCGRLGSVRTQPQLGHLQPSDFEVLDELQTAVDLYATLYLNDVNLQYLFDIREIDEPDASHIADRVRNVELEENIRQYFKHSNWVVLDDSVDIKALRERKGTEFMQTVVVDTFRSLGVMVFNDTDEGLGYYEEQFGCIELISLRFLFFGGRWHAMTFEWSD